MTLYIFLSHDVDWRKQGAPIEHILARKDRFDDEAIKNIHIKNPYYNIPEIMSLEEKFGVRTTFFFRTIYENGSYLDYEDDIQSLIKNGWEIGLHSDPSSVENIDKLKEEKTLLENLTKQKVLANRVHYLKSNSELPHKLQSLGFVYDSSIKKFRDTIELDDMNYYKIDKLIEFPITIMDAYLFTYMKIDENDIIGTFARMLKMGNEASLNNDFNIVSILWHDNVLKMKGGRMYEKILEYLTSQENVKIVRGIDLAEIVNAVR
ncbi:hypothetical protein DYY67_2247 [Candidatus Nitrosotalea sp. TS]|nr:hypothetical protein [Candidatus Nitrosotalea sp. TS]